MREVRALLAIPFLCGSGAVFSQSHTTVGNPPGPSPSDLAAVIRSYCITCHKARMAEAQIALDSLNTERPWVEADTWERVLRQLRARTMPPTDNPRPDPKTYEALVS